MVGLSDHVALRRFMNEAQNQGSSPADGEEVAIIDTTYGTIVFRFLPDKAPKHVDNFKSLAGKGFYDGTIFHRIIPGFMIQGGDPNTKGGARSQWGTGGPAHSVPAEFNDVSHVRGVVSMARSADPNSAGSQFFICAADSTFLDRQYTAFGRVLSGMDVVDKIISLPRDQRDAPTAGNEPTMTRVHIEKWPIA